MEKINPLTYCEDKNGTTFPVLVDENRQRHFNFTVDELLKSPWKVFRKMNEVDIEYVQQILAGPNFHRKVNHPVTGEPLKPIRDDLHRRKQDIKLARRELKKMLEAREKQQAEDAAYFAFVDRFNKTRLCTTIMVKDHIDHIHEIDNRTSIINTSRAIGTLLHDLKTNESGLYSVCAYAEYKNGERNKTTKEHYWPRSTVGGEHIFQHCLHFLLSNQEYTARDFFPIVCSVCSVNRTSKDENLVSLNKYQKRETFRDPVSSYQQAGIILVRTHEPTYHPFWHRLAEELDRNLPKFEPFPEISTEEADKILEGKAAVHKHDSKN